VGPYGYAYAIEILQSGLAIAIIDIWAFAFFYHLANGIRHLAWDIGWGFEMQQVHGSGWGVIGFSLLATAFTTYLLLGVS
jgi:succinate dehydrogenase / fumarate reductase cytochrome b subunit